MNERSPAEFDKAFWDIIVNTAARNDEIKSIVEWIFINDLKDLRIAEDIYSRMGELILEKYGIPENLHSEVYNQCENNMVERMVS